VALRAAGATEGPAGAAGAAEGPPGHGRGRWLQYGAVRARVFPAGRTADRFVHWVGVRARSQRWLWLVPFAVLYAMVRWPTGRIVHVIAAIVALGIVAWALRRPGSALIALAVFLPLQTVGFGFLLRLHVPTEILRPAGGLKELLGSSILLSALHALHEGRTRFGKTHQLDAIDKALLAYVGVVTLYLLFPHVFTIFPVSNHWYVRLLAWRADCGYLLLFFGVRHAPIAAATKRQFIRVLIAVAGVTILLGFYQWLAPSSWAHLILISGRQLQYQTTVLGNDPASVAHNLGYLTNFNPLRISSIFLSPFDMADFLLIVLAIAVERIARDYRSRVSYVLGAAILAALFASRVRADALAAVIVALLAMIPTPNRPISARLRLLGAILVAAVVVVPVLGGSRFVDAQGGAQSSRDHISEFTAGLNQLIHTPLGLGIGNEAGVGDRFVLASNQQGEFTVDNSVLQVGDELGIQALLPWLVLLILVFRGLGRASRRDDPFAGGIRLALLGVLVAGMYHQVFLSFPVAWLLWAAIALVLRPTAVAPVPETNTSRGNIASADATPAGDRT
jgi:hypothetical protein